MFDKIAEPCKLGELTVAEKELMRNDITYKKRMSDLIKEARVKSKKQECFYCNKRVSSFCNSHSIPNFCLKNIATKGEVRTLNTIVDNPLFDSKKGVKAAGTFQLICNDCDSKIFSDYENPDNYTKKPTSKMIAQIALKNSLKSISKRLLEIEIFNIRSEYSFNEKMMALEKNIINELDLKGYEESYKKAKKSLEKESEGDYYICYYKKLDYVVPIAFQNSIALLFDLEGNVINNVYNYDTKYKIHDIHLCVFPLKTESVIIMFIENGDKRYRSFYKQFNKLALEDQLATLTFIMFAYSEDIFFSESIKDEIMKSKALCDTGKTSTDIMSMTLEFDSLEVVRKSYDLVNRYNIPNLLSKKYKIL